MQEKNKYVQPKKLKTKDNGDKKSNNNNNNLNNKKNENEIE